MTKYVDFLSLLGRSSTLGVLLAISAIFGSSVSAQAQSAQGTFRTAVCGSSSPDNYFNPIPLTPGTSTGTGGVGASSTFITLTGAQAAGGFGNTSAGALLSQNGTGGVAGLNVRLVYPTVGPADTSNNFVQLQLNYKTAGAGAVKQNTTLKFCFQTNNGTGEVVSATIPLSTLGSIGTFNGFTRIALGTGNFGSFDASTSVLRKLSIQLSNNNGKANSVTVGDVQVYTTSTVFDPVGINLTQGSCQSLNQCPASPNAAE